MKYAIIENGKVVNIVLAEEPLQPNWVPCTNEGIGWVYDGETFEEPEAINPSAPVDPCEFLVDKGPFADRLYPYTLAVDMSTDPRVVAINKDLSRRMYINLKDPRVATTLGFLAGEDTPGLGTLSPALITEAVKTFALNNPVTLEENRSLRALYFKSYGL